jgi:hypothetical protein
MADGGGGRSSGHAARSRAKTGGCRVGRIVCVVVIACTLVSSVLAQQAGAFGRGFSWTPSSKEPYAACGHPAPGHAACLAVLVPPTSAASVTGPIGQVAPATASPDYTGTGIGGGYGPADLHSAYDLPSGSAGTGQTVAIVDAYNDPDAESDLAAYRTQYGLSPCTTANGCFRKVNQTGGTSYPKNEPSWAVEISLDLDMVSAACANCHILLVEATSSSSANLDASEDEAVALGATEVSNSWVGPEESGETSTDTPARHRRGRRSS